MTAASPAIETAGLGRDYGATRALDSLQLTVARGALVGLLGPNGAGKTTTMLLLATLLGPSRGSARVFGHDLVADRSAIRRCLGLVFQEPCIDGLLTVEENLLFAARLAGLSTRDARQAVDDALERTRLRERASQLGRQLSGGWRRLADIARATVHRPTLLILDEPTVGLDPEHRDRMWTLLEDERRARGTTILFSTHYLTEAEACDSRGAARPRRSRWPKAARWSSRPWWAATWRRSRGRTRTACSRPRAAPGRFEPSCAPSADTVSV